MLLSLNSLVLPEGAGLSRANPPTAKPWDPVHEARYDRHTLAYDVFYVPRKRAWCMICPALLNLETAFRSARIEADGRPLRLRRLYRFKRYAEAWFAGPETAQAITVEIGDVRLSVAPGRADETMFEGADVCVVRSKDNDLDWIADWARWHAMVHGATGIVFFDNGSTRYAPEDVETRLAAIPGMGRVVVVPAPFPYGVPKRHDTKFFTTGILNIARVRLLARARAALVNIDIDELVAPVPGSGIFAQTAASISGYRLFRGEWRDRPDALATTRPRHADHTHRVGRAICANTKYCIAPGGLLGWSHWDVHGAVRGFLKERLITTANSYWHCRNINTGWQHDRSATAGADAVTDAETAAALARVFGTGARPSAPYAGP